MPCVYPICDQRDAANEGREERKEEDSRVEDRRKGQQRRDKSSIVQYSTAGYSDTTSLSETRDLIALLRETIFPLFSPLYRHSPLCSPLYSLCRHSPILYCLYCLCRYSPMSPVFSIQTLFSLLLCALCREGSRSIWRTSHLKHSQQHCLRT